MPDSLLFDGSDDRINFSAGGINGTGALTCVVIAKVTANTSSFKNFFGWNAIDAVFGLDTANPANLIWFAGSGSVDNSVLSIDAANGWHVCALSKPDGTVAGRFHRYRYDTTTWTHDNGLDTPAELPSCTSVTVGASGVPGNFMDANILIAGWWDTELSDGTIETLTPGMQEWVDANPVEAWRLDTLSTIDSFVGTSTENSRTGTTLDTGDAPAGWTDLGVQNALAWIKA